MVAVLNFKDICAKGEHVHFARTALTTARPNPLHSHDFFELFWVQNGQVRHHLPDSTETLTEGDLVLVPPGQEHGVQAKGEHSLLVSVSLDPEVVHQLVARHQNDLPDLTTLQFATIDSRDLASLNRAALRLERSNRGDLATEAFLLPILLAFAKKDVPQNIPSWLIDAMEAARNPEVFQNGSAGLVALTGKAHAHVSRTMRAQLGQSPSEFINDIRMTYAARQLVTDDEAVQTIAEQCGIPNMAHFHKLFRERHGTTPLKYRQKYQRDVIQP
ncbi:transcriptional regulator, AraC family [Cognatiyoonia sediminum]|uniref:Transcriptional regulator, AraC family n=1 Tax=Cognatiyoonia sediminum TaxID=1508389 RepID=A0A1M5S2S9_9RHOB|nr:helix-turn-helix domain-containing protein [Cognatiyoonia sediminum]SHH32273.1 transcriptional regulator, AraC family [Cognatiyoonia sediminum]